jgi:DNA repair ATPase RecN
MVHEDVFEASLATLLSASNNFNNAYHSLSNAASSFGAVASKIEARFNELKLAEEGLREKKRIFYELNTLKEEQWKKEKEEALKKIEELRELQDKWEKTYTKMASNATAVADAVTLNVGTLFLYSLTIIA